MKPITVEEALAHAKVHAVPGYAQDVLAKEVLGLRQLVSELENQIQTAREQKPVAWLSAENYKRICPGLGKTVAIKMNKVKPDDVPLYAAPFHAAPAPAVPDDWQEVMAELAADLQACIEAEHAYRDQYSSVMRKYQNDMRIVERARALLQSAPASSVPAPAVPEEWREVMAGLVAIAEKKGKKQGSPNHCHKRPGVWDDDNGPALSGKPCAECAMYDKARALLQSAGGIPSQSQEKPHD